MDPVERDATLANQAIKKSKPDCKLILEIACTKTPDELLEVKRAYLSIYKHALEEDIASHTSGKIRKLLVGIVGTYRYHGDEYDEVTAYSDANILHQEIQEGGKSIHDETIRIISTRSRQQLLATFNRFKEIHGTSISKALRKHSDNEFFATSRVAIQCTNNPQKYFAKLLHAAIKGLGTDEDVLSRVIVTHAESDLKEISDIYFQRNNVTLDQAVAGDISGDYKTFLLTLLGTEGY